MGKPLLRPAVLADAARLAPSMRAEDAAEVLASGGYTPLQALEVSIGKSDEAWAWEVDGEVAAVFGVVRLPGPATSAHGAIWALTGDAVWSSRKAFLRDSRALIAVLLLRWDTLTNAVDARYASAIRWLRWLGAEVLEEPIPFGAAQLPFHVFRFTGVSHV